MERLSPTSEKKWINISDMEGSELALFQVAIRSGKLDLANNIMDNFLKDYERNINNNSDVLHSNVSNLSTDRNS